MLETSSLGRPSTDNQLLKLSKRLLEARDPETGCYLPSHLTTDTVIVGLMDIATIPEHYLPQMQRQASEPIKRRAVLAVRILIAALIQGGLPAEKAYDFFSMEDLNLLFYVHSRLSGAEQYPDIPLGRFDEAPADEQ
ncbi:hypothetical protein [Marinobacter sp.]|uniref:hypothetical protein n=1 Tax=Marinobacter sp. TaxID=50741 RepID=UPI000C3E5CA9|nr:hypothetical protein [Marinobacter sp.]MAO14397.1 hypothetical protein [Marinobacter sp.]